jgi:alpha-amylase/alpha-mannosidase (GH57 family)
MSYAGGEMHKYICIHGHFYQPPRENPWLEEIEQQDSAYPYHDWNERITSESYATNAVSRILDSEKKIIDIVNNYSKISFNFGPTLLDWVEQKSPDVYQRILEADLTSQKNLSGHGSALAQAYNHVIMPLANPRDKYTQVIWGIANFEHHFGRKPEGMWLPETAANLETLDILAQLGIKFTILAPYQASKVRKIGARAWRDVSGGRINPTTPYELRLRSGRKINLFFYDGPISRAVAFEGLLSNGENFARRLMDGFSEENTLPQLVHIATDGETYGHHHLFGDMALAYALNYVESHNLARLTNYGEYLEKNPPTHQVEIFEDTSWSCAHGIERWRSDCGCNSGGHPEWNQAWRGPLRTALDWLRDTLAPLYENKGRQLLRDPWGARDEYIAVILDRSSENIQRFLNQHATHELSETEKITVFKLLELQRHAMLMYTSCGWFFDELSGIETVQVMQYAGRVVQLADQLFPNSVAKRFLELLEQAKSNIPDHRDGRRLYERFVIPAAVDWEKLGAHYALSSLFEEYAEHTRLYCYAVQREDYQLLEAGKAKLLMGRAKMISEITLESAHLSFGVLHFGDHNLNGGVREFQGDEVYKATWEELSETFKRGDFSEIIRLLDKHFGESTYSIRSLFRDEQRRVLNLLLQSTLEEAETIYRQLYERNAPMIRFITNLGIPPPKAFYSTAQLVLNSNLRRAFEDEELDPERIRTLLEEAKLEGVTLEADTLEYTLRKSVERMADQLLVNPGETSLLERLNAILDTRRSLPFMVNLWKPQNAYYQILKTVYPEFRDRTEKGDENAGNWVGLFTLLGDKLSIRVQ